MRAGALIDSRETAWRVPPETGELRVAVLGAGKMARLHLETLKEVDGVRLVGVCSRTSASAERLAAEFGVERVHADAGRMLDESRPDAVFVAVSHEATYETSSLVARTGIPCLLEKPVGYTSGEVRRLAELADESGCLNVVGLNRRYYGVINQALLAVLHQGPVRGVVVEAHEPILEYRSRRQFAEWLYDRWMVANSIHGIDLLRMIGGEVAKVHAVKRAVAEPNGDSFSATVEFEGGALGTFVAHWNSGRGFGLKIYGCGVTAELAPLEQGFLQYATGRRVKLRPGWADTRFKPGLYAQNTAFLQAVCEATAPPFPASDVRDNVRTMDLVEELCA
jgi:predicted dehydrogenase